ITDTAPHAHYTLSLHDALPISQRRPKDSSKVIKTLINSFKYPRRGPGMMWETCAEKTKAMGGAVHMGCRVIRCEYHDANGTWTRSEEHTSELQSLAYLVCRLLL